MLVRNGNCPFRRAEGPLFSRYERMSVSKRFLVQSRFGDNPRREIRSEGFSVRSWLCGGSSPAVVS
jgi:hypothetical protein